MSVQPSVSKSQLAYQFLRQRIAERDYTPGYRLVLQPIADELGMSVVPVREAVRQLEAEGMVTFERNVGARVAMVDATTYLETMQVLAFAEGAATALAAPHLGPDEIAEARAINARLGMVVRDFDGHTFTRLNRQFHQTLFAACPNEHLRELVEAEWQRLDLLRSSTFSFIPERSAHSIVEHEELLRLIESGAPLGDVETAARRHRTTTIDAYLAAERGEQTSPLTTP